MELRYYWRLILGHKFMVLAIAVVAALATLAGTYLISPTYAAAARVQVLPGEQDPQSWLLRTGSQVNLPMLRDPTETFTQSAIEFIGSRPVAEEVVRRLQLDKPEHPADWLQWIRFVVRRARTIATDVVRYGEFREKDPFESAVDEVQRSLSGKLVKGTYMFDLVAKAKKPDLAVAIATTAVDIGIEQSGTIARQSSQERIDYVQNQLQKRADELHAAEKSVNDLRDSDQILSAVEQATALVKARYAAQEQLEKATGDLQQAQAHLDEVERQLQSTPSEITAALQVGDSSTSQEQEQKGTSIVGASTITTTTTSSNSQTNETSSSSHQTNSGSSDSATVDSKAKVSSSDSGRTESTQSAPPSTTESSQSGSSSSKMSSNTRTTSPNPTYQHLQQTRLDLQRQIEGLKAAQGQYAETLKAKDDEIGTWIQRDTQLSDLQLEARLAGDSYARVRSALVDEILSTARPTQQLRVMQQPTPPLYPSQPLRGLYVLGALGAGLLIGVTLALFIEYYRMSIRTAAQAQAVLGLPVLVRVPKLATRSAGSKRNSSQHNGHG